MAVCNKNKKINTDTSNCMWALNVVINYFTKHDQPVFSAAMDMSKTFDMVKWKHLLETLSNRGLSPIFVSLQSHMYTKQQ